MDGGRSAGTPGLNAMTCILLRGATVITMSPSRPGAECVDILIEDDRIIDIGERRGRPDAEPVDLSGRIVIPGLINAHLHTWQGARVWPAHDPIAAALHASLASIEAVMIPGELPKRGHALVELDLDDVRGRLLDSGERLLRARQASDATQDGSADSVPDSLAG